MDYTSQYESSASNALIGTSASEFFFVSQTDQERKTKLGSFNYLEIVNNSNNDVYIDFDGLTTKRRFLFTKSIIVIKADENLYFNTIKITNSSASTTIAADSIRIIARIMAPISTPVVVMR